MPSMALLPTALTKVHSIFPVYFITVNYLSKSGFWTQGVECEVEHYCQIKLFISQLYSLWIGEIFLFCTSQSLLSSIFSLCYNGQNFILKMTSNRNDRNSASLAPFFSFGENWNRIKYLKHLYKFLNTSWPKKIYFKVY